MKFGVRIPNLKKSVRARTTGKINRMAKQSINPLYGKKGMGIINNPKKATYNKVYNKTSINAFDLFKKSNNILYIIIIAFPCFCIVFGFQVLYYFCKYACLGVIWIFKKIINLIRGNKKEDDDERMV